MTEYLDSNGKKLEKGFYKYNNSDILFYFTGNYNENGVGIFERETSPNVPFLLGAPAFSNLNRIEKEKIKEKINWLEIRLAREEMN
jgi:hypothetical protein